MNVNIGLSFGSLGEFREGVDRGAHSVGLGQQGYLRDSILKRKIKRQLNANKNTQASKYSKF